MWRWGLLGVLGSGIAIALASCGDSNSNPIQSCIPGYACTGNTHCLTNCGECACVDSQLHCWADCLEGGYPTPTLSWEPSFLWLVPGETTTLEIFVQGSATSQATVSVDLPSLFPTPIDAAYSPTRNAFIAAFPAPSNTPTMQTFQGQVHARQASPYPSASVPINAYTIGIRGSLDPTFGLTGCTEPLAFTVDRVVPLASGSILFGGSDESSSVPRAHVGRLLANGALDTSFTTAIFPDNSSIVGLDVASMAASPPRSRCPRTTP